MEAKWLARSCCIDFKFERSAAKCIKLAYNKAMAALYCTSECVWMEEISPPLIS